jgi:hypothetical protein
MWPRRISLLKFGGGFVADAHDQASYEFNKYLFSLALTEMIANNAQNMLLLGGVYLRIIFMYTQATRLDGYSIRQRIHTHVCIVRNSIYFQ